MQNKTKLIFLFIKLILAFTPIVMSFITSNLNYLWILPLMMIYKIED